MDWLVSVLVSKSCQKSRVERHDVVCCLLLDTGSRCGGVNCAGGAWPARAWQHPGVGCADVNMCTIPLAL